MRRSGAPSQLGGNATKKARFMPPGPAQNDLLSRVVESGPSVPSPPSTPALGNVLLNKVKWGKKNIIHIKHISLFKLYVCCGLGIITIKHENNMSKM